MSNLLWLLGWTLLHSLWQLTLVGLAAALLLRSAGRGQEQVQYVIALVAMVACLGLPVITFVHGLLLAGAPLTSVQGLPAGLAAAGPLGGLSGLPRETWGARLLLLGSSHLAWLAGAWALGALGMGLRLAGGWLLTRRWRRAAVAAPGPWPNRFRMLADRVGAGGRVVLLATTRVATPMAMGLWRPVVLVPTALLTRLPEAYLEALLAHELAHVARLDFLVNFLQSLIEVLCFHHPVVWWLSRRVRTLREHLCDDRAALAIANPTCLALALDALDDVQPQLTKLALAADGGPLFARIQRLLHPEPGQGAPWALAPVLILLAAGAALALHANPVRTPPIAVPATAVAELDDLAGKEGLDPQLLRSLAWVESGCNPQAKSPQGATGLLQVSPDTARMFGARNLADPAEVTAAGARYLKHLLVRYHGDVAKAVTAYNCGEAAMEAGSPGAEAMGYRKLVMDVFGARAVQPAGPLGQAWVEGTFRIGQDGRAMLSARLSHSGNLYFQVKRLDRNGKPEERPVADLRSGSWLPDGHGKPSPDVIGSKADGPWVVSNPSMVMDLPQGSTILVQCESPEAGVKGETRIHLDGTWKTFAFKMDTPMTR
jgi:soluble lytic murein transglycosylase-like protein/Zn-dependent protease with chaperone function